MDKKDVLIHLLQFKGDNTATEILLRELRDFTIRSINKDAKDQFNGNRNHLLTEDDCPPITSPARAQYDWDKAHEPESDNTVSDVVKENTPDEIVTVSAGKICFNCTKNYAVKHKLSIVDNSHSHIEDFYCADKIVKVRSHMNTCGYYYCTKSQAILLCLEIISE